MSHFNGANMTYCKNCIIFLEFNMAAFLEELKLLSMPAPGKINLDNFEDDLTSAQVISKNDIYEDESENETLSESNLRRKAAVLLADEDKRYAGQAVSRKDLLKFRGDVSEDVSNDDGNIV